MAVADQITRLQNAKKTLKADLVSKGLPSSNTDKIDVLVNKIPLVYTKAYLDSCMSASNLFNANTQFVKFISMDDIEYDDTAKVRFFFQTFVGCEKVIPLNTSSGTEFLSMYWGCRKIKDFPDIDTHIAAALSYMYSNCDVAENVPMLDLFSATSMWGTYTKCYKLKKVEFVNWNLLAQYHGGICTDCHSLKAFVIRSFKTKNSEGYTVTPNKEFKMNNLEGCYHFHGTVDETYNPTGAKDGYIYVPSAYVDELKSATN
jgi:hypothetical protein